jgi:hypothetical protein
MHKAREVRDITGDVFKKQQDSTHKRGLPSHNQNSLNACKEGRTLFCPSSYTGDFWAEGQVSDLEHKVLTSMDTVLV